MSKPSTTGWTGGTAIEPSAGKKALGWLANERPPAPYLQWLFERIEAWLAFLDTLLTSGGGFTAPAGEHVTVSGAGRFKHGDMIKSISPYCFVDGLTANWSIGLDAGYLLSTGAGTVVVPIPMVVGERIKSLTYARAGTATSDFTSIQVLKLPAGGTLVDITAAATDDLNIGTSWGDKVVDLTDTTCTDGDVFWVRWIGNETGIKLGSIRVTYDRP